VVKYLKRRPPFAIEITLNAVTGELYEKISQVKGSFDKVMQGINLILKAKLPLKIKTQIIQDNLGEVPRIRKFIQGRGLNFLPSIDLYARLNGDLAPCSLRIAPEKVLSLDGKKHSVDEECVTRSTSHVARSTSQAKLFRCAIGGGDGIHIDPYGNTFSCNLIRKPFFNLLKVDVDYALDNLLPLVRNKRFTTDSKCNGCNLREFCRSCPGRAFVETKDMEAPVEYYCELAKCFEANMA
jgi:radical SAM protein with 4Fe4S-binding SPASM domain